MGFVGWEVVVVVFGSWEVVVVECLLFDLMEVVVVVVGNWKMEEFGGPRDFILQNRFIIKMLIPLLL